MRNRITVGGALAIAAAALSPTLGIASMQPPRPVHREPDYPPPEKKRLTDKKEKRKAQKAARAVTKRKGR